MHGKILRLYCKLFARAQQGMAGLCKKLVATDRSVATPVFTFDVEKSTKQPHCHVHQKIKLRPRICVEEGVAPFSHYIFTDAAICSSSRSKPKTTPTW
jgi:hypothetical protein